MNTMLSDLTGRGMSSIATTILALLSCSMCYCSVLAVAADVADSRAVQASRQQSTSQEKTTIVRKLTVKLPPGVHSDLSGKPGVVIIGSQQEANDKLGPEVAKQVVNQVDFSRETLVRAIWHSSGPPFGTIQYELKTDKNQPPTITFYVQEPKFPPGKPAVRGMALRMGDDYFAVPKEAKVLWGGARK